MLDLPVSDSIATPSPRRAGTARLPIESKKGHDGGSPFASIELSATKQSRCLSGGLNMRLFLKACASLVALTALSIQAVAQAPSSQDIRLEAKIPLGDVAGRIDHMAVDVARHRLFVAALGHGAVAVVDFDKRILVHLIRGLKEPQGVAYVAPGEKLLVANAGDGSVSIFDAADGGREYHEIGRIDLGADADNIRLDAAGGRAFVGYGNGAIAIIDTATLAKRADIRLKAHPESFQRHAASGRLFINIPRTKEIAVIDDSSGKQIASWAVSDRDNFPMAIHESGDQVLVAFRKPALLRAFAMRDGASLARVPTCDDADDLFVDAKRGRVYVSCGAGVLDVFAMDGAGLRRLAQIPTAPGARTSLYVQELDRLFVAAPARAGVPAAILVFTLG
jgi:hypothetical protein